MTWRVLKKLFGGWAGGIHTVFIIAWIAVASDDSLNAQDAFEALFFIVLMIGCGRAIAAAINDARNDVRAEALKASASASDGSVVAGNDIQGSLILVRDNGALQERPDFEPQCPHCGSTRHPVKR